MRADRIQHLWVGKIDHQAFRSILTFEGRGATFTQARGNLAAMFGEPWNGRLRADLLAHEKKRDRGGGCQ